MNKYVYVHFAYPGTKATYLNEQEYKMYTRFRNEAIQMINLDPEESYLYESFFDPGFLEEYYHDMFTDGYCVRLDARWADEYIKKALDAYKILSEISEIIS